MNKKIKRIKKEEVVLPDEVVLLEEACDVIWENADIAVKILHGLAFCSKCHGKRE